MADPVLIKKVLNVAQQIVYVDEANERNYRRVVGAVAWPSGSEPGCLAVVGEEWTKDLQLNAHRLWLIKEAQQDTIHDLCRRMAELRISHGADMWLGNRDNLGAMKVFQQSNRLLGRPLSIMSAPFAGEPLKVIDLQIGELLQPERKILTMGESKTAAIGQELTPKDMKHRVDEYPALAALGYAVTYLVLHQAPEQNQKKANVKKDWNPYNYFHGRPETR